MDCKYCHKTKAETEFGIAVTTSTKVYRRKKCNSCYQATKRKLRHQKSDWLQDYKKDKKCVNCGFDDPRALCFHHKNDKFMALSIMISMYSTKRIQEEINKCEILCANCHTIEHAKDRIKQRK